MRCGYDIRAVSERESEMRGIRGVKDGANPEEPRISFSIKA